MVANKILLIIATLKNGKKCLWVERRRADGTSVQLHRVLRGQLRNIEVIDGDGNYFSRVRSRVTGIDMSIYKHGGLFGPLVLMLGLVLCNVMVRVRFDFEESSVQMPLSEIKSKVRDAILSNPSIYTYCPHEEIVRRVNVAKSAESLIKSIVRD